MKGMKKELTVLLLIVPILAIGQIDTLKCSSETWTMVENPSKLIEPEKFERELSKLKLVGNQNEDITVEFIIDCEGIKRSISVTGLEQIEKYSQILNVIQSSQWTTGLQRGKPINFKVKLFLTILNEKVTRQPPPINRFVIPTEAYSIDEAVNTTSWSFPKTKLIMTSQDIESLSPEIGKVPFIRFLDLEDNKLKTLPNEIGELSNLEELYLVNNQISELPTEFIKLKSLRILGMAGNQLKTLPQQLLNLKGLQAIDLSSNGIESIPNEIENLKNLEVLIIRNNNLTTIPDSILKLKGLTTLDLSGNPITLANIKRIESKLKKTKVIFE
jgi:hypothetical protein